jgi:FkbM family methyltransferase
MQSHYLVENRHMAVKRCKHGLFMYNRNDAFISRGLDLYGEWCEMEIQVLRGFISPGDVVIDAGANIGTHAVAFANLVGPTGVVHAFEPQRRNFVQLAGNVALNGLDNVICHHKAVGDVMGEIKLPPLPPSDTTFNFGAMSIMDGPSNGERVPLVTLDSLELPACRLIKIDTEGMEPQALRGAASLIERCRPIIYVENAEDGASARLNEIINAFGYRAYWSVHWLYNEHNFYCNTENIWKTTVPASNLLCLPKESNVTLAGYEPFLGPDDDWKAYLVRTGALRQR